MRIRKRSAAGKLMEPLQETSNGCLHLHATSKSNPSFQDLRPPLISPAGITKQDHLLLAGSGYGATHKPSQKQLPVEVVSLKRKTCAVMSSGARSCEDDKGGLMMYTGEGNPRAKNAMDVQHINKGKHSMRIMLPDGDDNVKGVHMKGCKEPGLLWTSGEGDKLSEACKAGRHNIACTGSAVHGEIYNMHADRATVDASDCPRKVLSLQLILSSPSAPKLPLPLCPTRSSSAMLSVPPPLPRKFDKASPSVQMKTPPLTSSPAGMKQIADVKPGDELRNEDASSSDEEEDQQMPASREKNRAELESGGLVSSWQGHRRPRSHVKGGCGRSGVAAPDVNALCTKQSTEQTSRSKKPKHTKRKPIDILVSACASAHAPPPSSTSPSTPAGHGELRKQELPAALKHKTTPNEPLFLPTSAACLLPIPTKTIASLHTQPLPAANTLPTHTFSDPLPPLFPAPASDRVESQLDSMRCRRKDGRRWRCKAQVVKAGSPFCHYHTLKMREKHARSLVRRLSKQHSQGEVKISVSHADFSRSSSTKRASKRRRIRSSPSRKDVQNGYGGGCKVAEVEEEDEEGGAEREEINEELEEERNEDEQHGKLAGKQQVQESATMKRRWRKKCKPCIRRLHDIHDRARPAATDGVDWFNRWWEGMNKEDSPPVGSRSPLPECLLNTDPYEWQSDFP